MIDDVDAEDLAVAGAAAGVDSRAADARFRSALLDAGVGSTPGTGVDSFDREGPLEAERETAPVGGGVGFTPAGIGMSPGGGLCVVGYGKSREWENGGKWMKGEMTEKDL